MMTKQKSLINQQVTRENRELGQIVIGWRGLWRAWQSELYIYTVYISSLLDL